MRRKRKETPLRAIVYLSVKGKENNIDNKEEKQLNYITEYANAHNIKIVKINIIILKYSRLSKEADEVLFIIDFTPNIII